MTVRTLALLTGLAPLVGVNIAYVIGANADVIPTCIPYFDGCTSISAAGRYPPGDRLFRAVMLPQAVLLAVTWYLAARWLKSLSPATKAATPALVLGLIGALALILYVSYLGTREPFYELMRRFGIYFYFMGTGFAQIVLTFGLPRSRLRNIMLAILSVPWVLGIVNLVQKALLEDPDQLENAIEWIVSVFIQVWFLLLYVGWRKTGFRISVKIN